MDDRMVLFDMAREPVSNLFERFLIPPFSTLDRRAGYWQDRRRAWLSLGVQSELGRAEAMTYGRFENEAFMTTKTGNSADQINAGTSVFDPVLCELAYRWFAPINGHVLDPFAGGSVRGIAAAATGRRYTGIDLSEPQIIANRDQATAILGPDARYVFPDNTPTPTWIHADSSTLPTLGVDRSDLVFTCPPYGDLEVYSDDPRDLSRMDWLAFVEAYRYIIRAAVDNLRRDRFAVIVVSEIRQKDGGYAGLPQETIKAFEDAGARYYNEAVIIDPAGTAQLRARQFDVSRKILRCHQVMLVFVKGDPRAATEACGDPAK